MKNPKRIYIEAIDEKLDLAPYIAVWPPGLDVSIGSFGRMNGFREFSVKGNLSDFAEIVLGPPDEKPDGLSHATGRGVDVHVSAAGKLPDQLAAVAEIELTAEIAFSQKDQLVLRAAGVRYVLVRNERQFAKQILAQLPTGQVEDRYVFVSGIMTADSGAAIISSDSKATATLTGKGSVITNRVADLKADIGIGSSSKTAIDIPMPSGGVVAYRLLRLDDKGILRPKYVVTEYKDLDSDDMATEWTLEDPDISTEYIARI